jgi:hypothetical protein
MARRKKRTMKRKTSRRRIGAVGKGNIMDLVSVVAGAVIGRYVAKKVLPNLDEKIKNAAVIGVGLFLPKLMKSSTGKALGTGMVAAGGLGLVGGFLPAIAGNDDTIDFPMEIGEVEDGISVIAGDDVMAGDDLQVLAGAYDDDDDSDY